MACVKADGRRTLPCSIVASVTIRKMRYTRLKHEDADDVQLLGIDTNFPAITATLSHKQARPQADDDDEDFLNLAAKPADIDGDIVDEDMPDSIRAIVDADHAVLDPREVLLSDMLSGIETDDEDSADDIECEHPEALPSRSDSRVDESLPSESPEASMLRALNMTSKPRGRYEVDGVEVGYVQVIFGAAGISIKGFCTVHRDKPQCTCLLRAEFEYWSKYRAVLEWLKSGLTSICREQHGEASSRLRQSFSLRPVMGS
jgi:hypothetical protein